MSEDEPTNYYLEHPTLTHRKQSHHEEDSIVDEHHRSEDLAAQVREEFAKRHLGHKVIKQPVLTKESQEDIKDTERHGQGMSLVVDTLYDDDTMDHVEYYPQRALLVD